MPTLDEMAREYGSVENIPDSKLMQIARMFGVGLNGLRKALANPNDREGTSPLDLFGARGAADALEKIGTGRRVLPTMTQPMDPDMLDLLGVGGGIGKAIEPAAKALAKGAVREFAEAGASGMKAGRAAQEGRIGETAEVSRAKRRKKDGEYVGAPPGIDSPQKFNNLINGYVERMEEALDNGVPRGYFYEQGSKINKKVTDNPEEMQKFALTQGVTSSEAPVMNNTGWAIKALEQDAMGVPIHTGKYPNNIRDKLTTIMDGEVPDIGTKTHRYAAALNDEKGGLAPNDRWEIRSLGYDKDTLGPAQHDFMDEVRKRAVERFNAKHNQDLSILEGQELNWATQRARDMNIPHTQAAADTIQDSVKPFTFQHSWESRGGEKAKHLNDLPPEMLDELHGKMKGIMLDEDGKDKLIRGMGGRLQLPAVDGPGVYEGVVSPGTQSRSLAYATNEGGLDPTSLARVEGTEAMRAWMLGQDAYAGHSVSSPKSLSGPKTDTMGIDMGRVPTSDEAVGIQALLDDKFGGAAGMVPTEKGFNALRFDENPKFAETFTKGGMAKLLEGIVGGPVSGTPGKRAGIYGDLGWGEGTATADMLAKLESGAAPNLVKNADSPEIRELAGKIAATYDEMTAKGFTPNAKLVNAMKVLKEQGLEGLRKLVASGAAPAVGAFELTDLQQDR